MHVHAPAASCCRNEARPVLVAWMLKRARVMALGPEAQRSRATVGLLQLERRRTATGDAPHNLDERSGSETSTRRRCDPHPNAARGRRERPRVRHRARGVARSVLSHGCCTGGKGRRRVARTAARGGERDNRHEHRHGSIRHSYDSHHELSSRRAHFSLFYRHYSSIIEHMFGSLADLAAGRRALDAQEAAWLKKVAAYERSTTGEPKGT